MNQRVFTRSRMRWLSLTGLAYAMLVLTLLKIAAVVFHTPLFGYANSYDFVRKSACVGIWQDYPGQPKGAGFPFAPVNSLVFDDDRRTDICAKSSDNFFAHISRTVHRVGDRVDFREMSAYRLLMLTSLGLALMGMCASGPLKVFVALLFGLVWGDFTNALYFNTLYNEFSVLLGSFFASCCLVILAGTPRPPGRPRLLLVLLTFAIIWLGFSKQQYMPLASVLALIAAGLMWLRLRARGWALGLVALALAFPPAYAYLNRDDTGLMADIDLANKTDTFMAAVLPEATDQQQALRTLGLPPECAAGIGKSWYDPDIQQHPPCAALKQVSRARLLSLFLQQPRTFYIPLIRSAYEAHKMYPEERLLGHVAQASQSQEGFYQFSRWGSLAIGFSLLPEPVFVVLIMGVWLLAALALLRLTLVRFRPQWAVTPATQFSLASIAMGGLLVLYALASSVFGDGYIDVPKHALLIGSGLAFVLCGLGAMLINAIAPLLPVLTKRRAPAQC